MSWEKKGLIFQPKGSGWQLTHAQNPFGEFIEEHLLRIFYSARDEQNRARGGVFEYNLKHHTVHNQSEKPIFDLGRPGAFDDCGVMPSCLVNQGGNQYLYYTGWSKAVVVPFTFFIALRVG